MTLSWKRKPLEERARISVRRRNEFNEHWPRRFFFFGPRVVPLEVFILALAKTHRSRDKGYARMNTLIASLHRGIQRRNKSGEKAGAYIKDLKLRVALLEASRAIDETTHMKG